MVQVSLSDDCEEMSEAVLLRLLGSNSRYADPDAEGVKPVFKTKYLGQRGLGMEIYMSSYTTSSADQVVALVEVSPMR